ncbi:hypothetical protein [Marasmitruncus massiliensis]|uniref:hypothetical protein n=1 Tax=Marasmitruncus massiliensis TaxID=1944642 RepID=UPI000C7DB781|nr:hypothetical protein [Marasmitruncus massiliensis]
MRARTIYEPYAWGIFHGLKHFETVPHPCHIRGTIAIHAAKSTPAHASIQFFKSLLEQTDDLTKIKMFSPEWVKSLPYGAVLGTVEIINCVPAESIRDGLPKLERVFGDFSDGRYALVLADPVPLERPVPAKGQQGWWNWEKNKSE